MTAAIPTEATTVTRDTLGEMMARAREVDLGWLQRQPRPQGWSLAPDALRFLSAAVAVLSPRHVLELGCGLSTCVLARAAGELPSPGRLTSVDHDRRFIRETARMLHGQARKCPVRFQFAPLVVRECTERPLPMYDLHRWAFASRRSPELIVIDGPPAVLGGREGTLYQVLDVARPGTLVLLDDASRNHEQEILRRWQSHLGEAIEVVHLPGFAKGLAAIIVRQVVPRFGLWAHGLELAARDIAAVVPEHDTFILVDDGQWAIDAGPRRVLPFLERDGAYWGPPADDAAAVGELERLRRAGAHFIVFARPAFWWLEQYREFLHELRSTFDCVIENERLVVFDLRV